jgi:hypothetical protein
MFHFHFRFLFHCHFIQDAPSTILNCLGKTKYKKKKKRRKKENAVQVFEWYIPATGSKSEPRPGKLAPTPGLNSV